MSPRSFKNISKTVYPFAKKVLFALDAEQAHHLTIRALAFLQGTPLLPISDKNENLSQAQVSVMGLTFPNRLGLAAGLDKGAQAIDAFGALGFGHVEVGTLTPRPQTGNPRPRLFRLIPEEAIINRMGFNNPGVNDAVIRMGQRRFRGVLGVNIGKNADTPNENAISDYVKGLRAVYAQADYVAVNLSSPNTKNLRELQLVENCRPLLKALHAEREALARGHEKRVPLAIKIAPDLEPKQIEAMADLLVECRMDAVIATNTTISRDAVAGSPLAAETGGLSGRPLTERSTEVIACLHGRLQGTLPIIGVGGIFSGSDALAKLEAGASLVQIYTGFIYRGPALIEEILEACAELEKAKRR